MDEFYKQLFTENSYWSTRFPNIDEASRWAKICKYLSLIACQNLESSKRHLRILDVGCGRGWLTNLANTYGTCDGIDPVTHSIDLANKYFPDLSFTVGEVPILLDSPKFEPYDVVIVTEVIEHVIDKETFLHDLTNCLTPDGYLILTTPRGELYHKWLRMGPKKQPVEEWVSERYLRLLLMKYHFRPMEHDRIYVDLPRMSKLSRLCASSKASSLFAELSLMPILKGLQFSSSIYQIWLCKLDLSTNK